MRIEPIITTTEASKAKNTGLKRNGITFGTYNPTAARAIEENLARRGIMCDAKGNDFLAECYKNTVDLFEKLFGKSHLPYKLTFKPLKEDVYGIFAPYEVTMNKQYDYKCFYDMDSLKKESEKNYNWILPGWNSTKHPAHVFVHEFSHATHWNHLENRKGWMDASKAWTGLNKVQVPTGIGKLITKFKISGYAVKGDMREFLAERMTKDICAGITDNMWVPYKDIDVDYSHIFSKKWNYRYSSPQSYIDYFTQQVWDGNIDEAKRAGDMAEAYLAELEGATKTAPLINKIAKALDYTPSWATPEDKPLLYKIGTWISKGLVNTNEKVTKKLDRDNQLKLNL